MLMTLLFLYGTGLCTGRRLHPSSSQSERRSRSGQVPEPYAGPSPSRLHSLLTHGRSGEDDDISALYSAQLHVVMHQDNSPNIYSLFSSVMHM